MNAATPSVACLKLVKRFEGFRPEALALGADRWLVGYGHVRAGQPASSIGESEAEFLLKEDLEEISQVVRRAAPNRLSQNQFDALASFGFSLGVEAFEASDVIQLVREGAMLDAAAAMEDWVVSEAGEGPDEILLRRRAAEKALFLTVEESVAAPSALLRPRRTQSEPGEPATAPVRRAPPAERTDVLGLAALGVLGLLLIAMGVTGADDDHGMAYFVFAAPGLVGVAMSVYYLLKKTVDAV
jgi:GH24 family phage-related lysozyme (muramidase)